MRLFKFLFALVVGLGAAAAANGLFDAISFKVQWPASIFISLIDILVCVAAGMALSLLPGFLASRKLTTFTDTDRTSLRSFFGGILCASAIVWLVAVAIFPGHDFIDSPNRRLLDALGLMIAVSFGAYVGASSTFSLTFRRNKSV